MPKSPKEPFLGEKDKMVLKLCVTTDVMIIGEFWVQLLGSTTLLFDLHFLNFNELNFDEFGDGQRELAHSLQKKQQPPPTKQNHDLQICIGFALQRHFFHTFLSVFLCRWQGFTPNNPRLMKSQEGPHRKWRRSVTENERNEAPGMGTRVVRYQPGTCEFVLYVGGFNPPRQGHFQSKQGSFESFKFRVPGIWHSKTLTSSSQRSFFVGISRRQQQNQTPPNTVGFNQTFQSVDG